MTASSLPRPTAFAGDLLKSVVPSLEILSSGKERLTPSTENKADVKDAELDRSGRLVGEEGNDDSNHLGGLGFSDSEKPPESERRPNRSVTDIAPVEKSIVSLQETDDLIGSNEKLLPSTDCLPNSHLTSSSQGAEGKSKRNKRRKGRKMDQSAIDDQQMSGSQPGESWTEVKRKGSQKSSSETNPTKGNADSEQLSVFQTVHKKDGQSDNKDESKHVEKSWKWRSMLLLVFES